MTATTVSQAVEKRDSGPVALMWNRKRHFDAVLPASVDVEAFLGTAAGALYGNRTLMEYAEANPDSLIIALMRCAALGHLPGTDEFYLTPRKDHGRPKVLGIEGYRGVIERMYRSGAVAKVVVREVCANDPFSYVEGVDDKPRHEVGGQGVTGADFFASRDRGEMVGVYAYAELLTGAISRVVLLTRDDVFAARNSGGWKPEDKFSPWNRADGGQNHPEFTGRSMWWKTGAKRLEPWVPTSAEYRREQLRASASAATLGQRRDMPDLPPASMPGLQITPELEDIHDAEIVDDQQQPEPAPDRGRAPSRATLLGKIGKLLVQVPLGPAEDVGAFLAWQAGDPDVTTLEKLDRDQAALVHTALDEALAAAENDGAQAASALWDEYKKDHPDAAAS